MARLAQALQVVQFVGSAAGFVDDVVNVCRLRDVSFIQTGLAQIAIAFERLFAQLLPLPAITALGCGLALLSRCPIDAQVRVVVTVARAVRSY